MGGHDQTAKRAAALLLGGNPARTQPSMLHLAACPGKAPAGPVLAACASSGDLRSALAWRIVTNTQDPRGALRLRRPSGLQQLASQLALLVGHVVHGRQSQEIVIDVVAHRARVLERAGHVDALDVLRMHPENLLDGRVPGSPIPVSQHPKQGRDGLVQQLMNPSVDVLV